MSDFVTDTHALLWHLSEDPALSTTAKGTLRLADTGQAEIFIPSIVLAEVVYLTERQRVPADQIDRIANLPDMPDRIIAATALFLGLPLLTRDSRIAQLGMIQCVW